MRSLQSHAGTTLPPRAEPRPASIYKTIESFHSIAIAWEAIAAEQWSTSAMQSFATLARRNALELSTLGCGALDRALVELVLALDAITVTYEPSAQQVQRVDHAIAHIRAVTTQRILALELPMAAAVGEASPVLCAEPCARCGSAGVCAFVEGRAPL